MFIKLIVTVILAVLSILPLIRLSRYLLVLEIIIYFLFATILTTNYFRITESVYHLIRISNGVQGLWILQLEFSFILPSLLVWVTSLFLRRKFLYFLISACIWLVVSLEMEFVNVWMGAMIQKENYLIYGAGFHIVILVIELIFVFTYRNMLRREGFKV